MKRSKARAEKKSAGTLIVEKYRPRLNKLTPPSGNAFDFAPCKLPTAMNPRLPQVIAADTNVGLDLAQADEWVLDAVATIRQRLAHCSLVIPPTVLDELEYLASHAEEAKESGVLRTAPNSRGRGVRAPDDIPLTDSF